MAVWLKLKPEERKSPYGNKGEIPLLSALESKRISDDHPIKHTKKFNWICMSGHYASISKLTLRPTTLRDADLLLAWRNDPETQKASLHQTEIQADEHLRWLNKNLNNPNLRLLIAEQDGSAVGTVRAEFSDGVWELSWTIAPEHRGSGIGKQMVALLACELSGPIQAKVKSDNPASARIAAHVGMTLDREADGILYYSNRAK